MYRRADLLARYVQILCSTNLTLILNAGDIDFYTMQMTW